VNGEAVMQNFACIFQSTTGFIHMKLEEEPPIFSKQKVNFSPTDRITHLAVSNELLVLAMANSVLLLIDLRQPNNPQGNDGFNLFAVR
jgi:hypothetical protein